MSFASPYILPSREGFAAVGFCLFQPALTDFAKSSVLISRNNFVLKSERNLRKNGIHDDKRNRLPLKKMRGSRKDKGTGHRFHYQTMPVSGTNVR